MDVVYAINITNYAFRRILLFLVLNYWKNLKI